MTSPRCVLVCPDSFKGSLTARHAAIAMARGARQAFPGARIIRLPLADGGEGTLDALAATAGRRRTTNVTGPLGKAVQASWLLFPGRTAVIESAAAAGLLLVPPRRRNPLHTTTQGVGELIRAALNAGARRIIVTLGGSATVDGGLGLAQALGVRCMDAERRPVPSGGIGLERLDRIDGSALKSLRGVTVIGATDVRNPLLGRNGAARVFGPQKGATPRQVERLERGMRRYARILARDLGRNVAGRPGAGAAGGMGAALLAFLNARLVSGADLLFDLVGLDAALRRADLVLTGEGSLDAQTAGGKLVARVAARARRHGVPVVAFAGRMTASPRDLRRIGVRSAYAIAPAGMPTATAMRRAAPLLEAAVSRTLHGR